MDFAKYHALGNDYLIIDPQHTKLEPSAHSARLLCDRRFGIGADGVLFGPCSPVASGKPVEVATFNADGSACHRSANGIRIFASYLADHYPGESLYTMRTAAGDSQVEVLDRLAGSVRIEMGRPSFDPCDIPVTGVSGPAIDILIDLATEKLAVTCVAIGTPHAVIFAEEVSPARVQRLGPLVAGHPRFPERVNVSLARVPDRRSMRIEIWERGAGYTTSSGAASCAAASAARASGLVDDQVTVHMPGGDLEVAFGADGSLTLSGIVEQVAVGEFAPAYRALLASQQLRSSDQMPGTGEE